LRSAYKTLLETEPQAVPGWCLRPGARVRQIADIARAYTIATTEAGITQEDFLRCAEINITALQALCGANLKLSGKALLERFNDLFATVIAFKANAPSLARVSKRKLAEPIPEQSLT
jgi:hypothetical protein